MDLDPTRRAGDVLPVVLGSPTFDKTHPNRAHLGQFKDGAVAVVYRLSTAQPTMISHSCNFIHQQTISFSSSSSRMHVMNHNWSATKQCLSVYLSRHTCTILMTMFQVYIWISQWSKRSSKIARAVFPNWMDANPDVEPWCQKIMPKQTLTTAARHSKPGSTPHCRVLPPRELSNTRWSSTLKASFFFWQTNMATNDSNALNEITLLHRS